MIFLTFLINRQPFELVSLLTEAIGNPLNFSSFAVERHKDPKITRTLTDDKRENSVRCDNLLIVYVVPECPNEVSTSVYFTMTSDPYLAFMRTCQISKTCAERRK